MQITRGRPSSPSSDARTGDHIDQLQEVVRELRRAIFGMEPGPAVPPRLRTSLMQMITMLTRGSPLRTSVQMSGALDELPPDLAEHAAGVVREGVGNAVRHSHAAELIITIAVEDELVVQVIDDGVGSADPVAGAGLHDLRRRRPASRPRSARMSPAAPSAAALRTRRLPPRRAADRPPATASITPSASSWSSGSAWAAPSTRRGCPPSRDSANRRAHRSDSSIPGGTRSRR